MISWAYRHEVALEGVGLRGHNGPVRLQLHSRREAWKMITNTETDIRVTTRYVSGMCGCDFVGRDITVIEVR